MVVPVKRAVNWFSLSDCEPVLLEHWCVCSHCGLVYGPMRYFVSGDGVSRMVRCDGCDPRGEMGRPPASNVGAFVSDGMRATR